MSTKPSTVRTTASTRQLASGKGNGLLPARKLKRETDAGFVAAAVTPVASPGAAIAVLKSHRKDNSGSSAQRLSSATATSVETVEAVWPAGASGAAGFSIGSVT